MATVILTILVFVSLCISLSFLQLNDDYIRRDETELLSRHKRMLIKDHEWTNGIVPYIYTSSIGEKQKLEIESAVEYVEKYTCIRFVARTNQTRARYNLDHDNYVIFKDAGSCYSTIGNTRRKNGQVTSCCDRYSCVHELGHVLGLHHTHHSYHAGGWIRINWDEIQRSHLYVYRMLRKSGVVEYTYDITSMMHYPETMYKTTYRPTMNNLIRTMKIGGNRFYSLRDVNWYHHCKDKRCNWFHKKCENDGYVTTVKGRCDCICPLSLDPVTGCTTIRKTRKKHTWPSGHFALMAAHSGCPDGKFGTGSLTHWGNGRNWHTYTWTSDNTKPLHLKGVHTWKRHTYYFCISKNYSPFGREWPPGSYCILREGELCPHNFKEGSIQFDNEIRSRRQNNSHHGELPDGVFGKDTLLYFCCRYDGLTKEPMDLPNDKPLILFQAKSLGYSQCQAVSGMAYLLEYFLFDNVNGGIAALSGAVPRSAKYPGSDFLVYFCYYEPIDYNCGDVITLDRNNPSTVIISPNYPSNYNRNQECVWLIKAPVDSKLMLRFEDFDIENNCVDYVALGVGYIGQYGKKMCGSWNRDSYQTIFNTLNVKFRSSMTEQRRGFKAKVSIIRPEDMCYIMTDNGKTYRGKVNVTELRETCLPWAEVTHCPHHPFKHGDYEDGLQGNYCRNPGDGLVPWCYTQKDGCERQYCDVCLKGLVHDRYRDCEELMDTIADFCTNDLRASSNCAKSCQSQLPSLPSVIKVNEVRCSKPANIQDSNVVGNTKTFYSVGETIQYKCKETEEVLTRTCLTDSSWTTGGFVCGACQMGWAVFRRHCYKYFDTSMEWNDADKYCKDIGGELTTDLDPTEHSFLNSIRIPLLASWLGLTDQAKEGRFVWSNGQPVQWTKFKKGTPDNKYNSEHCVVMLGDEHNTEWDDKYCKYNVKYGFICKVKPKGRFLCADRLNNCPQVLEETPAMCIDHPGFSWTECPKTCGMCDKHLTKRCKIPTTPDYVNVVANRRHLYRGRVVRYVCKTGYLLQSGNLDRVCKADGKLSGRPPVCTPENKSTSVSSPQVLKNRKEYGSEEFVYTGKTPELLIPRRGKILEWQFYSGKPGDIALQVYRPSSTTNNSYTLISSRFVRSENDRIQIIRLPKEEQTLVEEDDLLGVWYGSKDAGLSLEKCGKYYKPSYAVRKAKITIETKAKFKPGLVVDFSSGPSCEIFSLRVLLGPIDD